MKQRLNFICVIIARVENLFNRKYEYFLVFYYYMNVNVIGYIVDITSTLYSFFRQKIHVEI
jgi:hypothetical protein